MDRIWLRPLVIWFGAFFFLAVLLASVPRRGRLHPLPAPSAPYRPLALGFYENPGSGGGDSLASLQAHGDLLQIVSPNWYEVDGAGNIAVDRSLPSVANTLGTRGIRNLPLVANLGSGVLESAGTRQNAVANLIATVDRGGYDGLLLDFELLPPVDRSALTRFAAALAGALHARHKMLAVAVFPKVQVSGSVAAAYDYGALGTLADLVVLMAYDRHSSGAPPGPVAPLWWVKANLNYALTRIPADRLMLGIGTYGYDWGPSGSPAVTVPSSQADALAATHGATVRWSNTRGEPYFTYLAADGLHQVWFENRYTVAQKLNLVRRYRLKGFSLWRLGYEDDAIWREVRTAEGT